MKKSPPSPQSREPAYQANAAQLQQQRKEYAQRVQLVAQRELRRPIGAARDTSRYPGTMSNSGGAL